MATIPGKLNLFLEVLHSAKKSHRVQCLLKEQLHFDCLIAAFHCSLCSKRKTTTTKKEKKKNPPKTLHEAESIPQCPHLPVSSLDLYFDLIVKIQRELELSSGCISGHFMETAGGPNIL